MKRLAAALLVALCLVESSATALCEGFCMAGEQRPGSCHSTPTSEELVTLAAADATCQHDVTEQSLRAERSLRDLKGVAAFLSTPDPLFPLRGDQVARVVSQDTSPPQADRPRAVPLRI